MSRIRLMSQNQWNCTHNNPYWAERGLDCSSPVRMKGHVRVIREIMPDVIGGQEVNHEMLPDMGLYFREEGLPYTLIWGNMTPILYRSDRLELLENEFLLYPEEMEGFEGSFNDVKSKSANLAVFRVKENGRVLIFVTTHLWWKNGQDPDLSWYQAGSDQVRKIQLGMAMDMIDRYQKKYPGCPAVLVGDLNTPYHSEAIRYALNERGYSHAHNAAVEFAHEGKGYNPCAPSRIGPWQDEPFENAIDHILVRDFPEGAVRRFDRYTPDYYIYLSDHAPVYADIEL